jgi:hypothetical protein
MGGLVDVDELRFAPEFDRNGAKLCLDPPDIGTPAFVGEEFRAWHAWHNCRHVEQHPPSFSRREIHDELVLDLQDDFPSIRCLRRAAH